MEDSYLDSGDIKLRGAWNNLPIGQTECLARNARMRLAISSFFSSKAKWPASSRWISASRRSRSNASAPGAMNEGSFRPQTTKVGGLCSRNGEVLTARRAQVPWVIADGPVMLSRFRLAWGGAILGLLLSVVAFAA